LSSFFFLVGLVLIDLGFLVALRGLAREQVRLGDEVAAEQQQEDGEEDQVIA